MVELPPSYQLSAPKRQTSSFGKGLHLPSLKVLLAYRRERERERERGRERANRNGAWCRTAMALLCKMLPIHDQAVTSKSEDHTNIGLAHLIILLLNIRISNNYQVDSQEFYGARARIVQLRLDFWFCPGASTMSRLLIA